MPTALSALQHLRDASLRRISNQSFRTSTLRYRSLKPLHFQGTNRDLLVTRLEHFVPFGFWTNESVLAKMLRATTELLQLSIFFKPIHM